MPLLFPQEACLKDVETPAGDGGLRVEILLFAFPCLTGKIDESFRLPSSSWWREKSVFKGGTGSPSVCSQIFGQVTEA
ncbi:hypothetical protein ACSAZL_03670 [Methanosarcina sp. T3]|uniref:hypothetical protein n=1 Tax=Methanosarcina sp. T3 TaxID=3439062 RepID=UPI003F85FDA7